VIGGLRRALVALLGGQTSPPRGQNDEPSEEPAERIDAAKRRLKDTIPPPEDD
jgi:hypothetical protein